MFLDGKLTTKFIYYKGFYECWKGIQLYNWESSDFTRGSGAKKFLLLENFCWKNLKLCYMFCYIIRSLKAVYAFNVGKLTGMSEFKLHYLNEILRNYHWRNDMQKVFVIEKVQHIKNRLKNDLFFWNYDIFKKIKIDKLYFLWCTFNKFLSFTGCINFDGTQQCRCTMYEDWSNKSKIIIVLIIVLLLWIDFQQKINTWTFT